MHCRGVIIRTAGVFIGGVVGSGDIIHAAGVRFGFKSSSPRHARGGRTAGLVLRLEFWRAERFFFGFFGPWPTHKRRKGSLSAGRLLNCTSQQAVQRRKSTARTANDRREYRGEYHGARSRLWNA